jgi:hypothetical protein
MRVHKGEQFTPELLWLSREGQEQNSDPFRIVAEPSPNLSREKNGRGSGGTGEGVGGDGHGAC